jgi:hypothetical protein
MPQDSLEVRPGEPITAEKWNRVQRTAYASQILRGGDNTRTLSTPKGTLINTKHGGGWNHPWRVVASQLSARVYPGTVNGAFPTIRDSDGTEKQIDVKPPPYLNLSQPSVNDRNNVGWIALELKLKEDYREIETAKVVQVSFIVGSELHTDNPFFFFGLPGIGNFSVRYPLARLQYFPNTNSLEIYQVAMFNLNHVCKPPDAQRNGGAEPNRSSLPRHFFYPA